MKILLSGAAIMAALAGALTIGSSALAAQDDVDQSNERAFCSMVQSLGNGPTMNARILDEVNRRYAGYSKEYNRRKTFKINRADLVTFSGCSMRIQFSAELQRKIRRDAEGTIYVDATMKNLDLNLRTRSGRACVKDAEVDQIRMSNSLRIGEAVYRGFANSFLDREMCFNFSTASG